MSFNAEFVKNRSFEIAWAIFRCAALAKNSHLKSELEKSAVNLAAEFGKFEPQKDFKKEKAAIDSLNNLIRLAEVVGEFNSINSLVLFRELDNLFNAVQSLALDLSRKEENEELRALEGIFSASLEEEKDETAVQQDFGLEENEFGNDLAKQNIDFSTIYEEKGEKLPNIILAKAPENKFLAPKNENLKRGALPSIKVRQGNTNLATRNDFKSLAEQKRPANLIEIIRQEDEKLEIDSWQDLIYRKIKEIRQVTTKELASIFPQISERTIRFYLQKLVESNLVSKKGSTGPGIYYTA